MFHYSFRYASDVAGHDNISIFFKIFLNVVNLYFDMLWKGIPDVAFKM
jgi:hypothetical protein